MRDKFRRKKRRRRKTITKDKKKNKRGGRPARGVGWGGELESVEPKTSRIGRALNLNE